MDLSKLTSSSFDQGEITNTNNMLNINELKYTIDSLNTNYKKDLRSFTENIYLRTGVNNTFYQPDSSQVRPKVSSNNLLANLTDSQKNEVFKIAFSNIENTVFSIDSSIFEMQGKNSNYLIKFHTVTKLQK